MPYHTPRFYRTSPRDRWHAVGVDQTWLKPWCETVARPGVVMSIGTVLQVKLCNGQVINIRPLRHRALSGWACGYCGHKLGDQHAGWCRYVGPVRS